MTKTERAREKLGEAFDRHLIPSNLETIRQEVGLETNTFYSLVKTMLVELAGPDQLMEEMWEVRQLAKEEVDDG